MRSNTKSPARQHAEWLSLVEVSGPFLTLTVLNHSFKFGLDAHDAELYRAVKEAYQEWEDSTSPAIHQAWIRFLLTTVLGYPKECIGEAQAIPESAVADLQLQGERVRPDLAILDPDDPQKVRVPILVYSRQQKLDSPVAGSSWAASPHARMQVLLQNTAQQVGFVTNGSQWSLVHVRKGEPTGFATWQTELLTEEKILLQAFKGILGVERTLGSPDGESLFDLLDKSAQDQEEVTKELGRQVREAVEVFVNALDRLDKDSGRGLLADQEPKTVYNSALTVMMRLIFLLCAEERDLMDRRSLYVENYSVGALNDQLREIASGDEQVLEHRHDAWKRLLATFRLVHGGCDHEDLNLPAYGGSLFDPTKYPFLERCQVDNRVTLHLLDALEFLQIKVPGGGREQRRLSFRALGVEQIGHVYEGLLDHTALRAEEPVVGLTGKESEEAEIALSILEEHRSDLGKFFEKEKIKVTGNPDKLLSQPPDLVKVSQLRVACGGDDALFDRVLPFLNLVRGDSLEHLQVYPVGSLYVTAGADRRSSGTHYTPVSLTEEVVQYALEPQVYVGPAEGLPRNEWKLKSAKEIIDLKVCDMAMGSGAFLVQACRYLSERLVEAWQEIVSQVDRPLAFTSHGSYVTHPIPTDHWAKKLGSYVTTPIGELVIAERSRELISENPEERLAQARRIIADRCLNGVDINPMAVEMAKLSLWLTTMQRDRPFTFLDHALKTGDSLLGVTQRQLMAMTMRPDKESGSIMFHWVPKRLEEVLEMRKQLGRIPSHDPDSVRRKAQITLQAEIKSRWLQEAADILMLSELRRLAKHPMTDNEWDRLMAILREGPYKLPDEIAGLKATRESLSRSTFNWELAYPEIFDSGGFDCIIGNPPFLGGSRISAELGDNYRQFIVSQQTPGFIGRVDLCAYFLVKANALKRPNGSLGMIATTSITEGHTREALEGFVYSKGTEIYRATRSVSWPGGAQVFISKVWASKGSFAGQRTLDGSVVSKISAALTAGVNNKRERLVASSKLCFRGIELRGDGFILSKDESDVLCDSDCRSQDIIRPFLNGAELNRSPGAIPEQYVIDFGQRTERDCRTYTAAFQRLEQLVKPVRDGIKGPLHEKNFWRFYDKRVDQFSAISAFDRILVKARDSVVWAFCFVPKAFVIGSKVVVFKSDDAGMFAVIQSVFHRLWCEDGSSSIGQTTLTYNPTFGIETFPLPPVSSRMRQAGMAFHRVREDFMASRCASLNDVHSQLDLDERSTQMAELRLLSVEIDKSVSEAFGWQDLDMDHGFYGEGRERRFTISPAARREVLRRLLKLNHERYQQELEDGLHDKGKPKPATRSQATNGLDVFSGPRRNLFDEQLLLGEGGES